MQRAIQNVQSISLAYWSIMNLLSLSFYLVTVFVLGLASSLSCVCVCVCVYVCVCMCVCGWECIVVSECSGASADNNEL